MAEVGQQPVARVDHGRSAKAGRLQARVIRRGRAQVSRDKLTVSSGGLRVVSQAGPEQRESRGRVAERPRDGHNVARPGPERHTAVAPAGSEPSAVTETITESALAVSPPATPAPARLHSAAIPEARSSAPVGGQRIGQGQRDQQRGRDRAHGRDVRKATRRGLDPGVVPRGPRAPECRPSIRKSTAATTLPSGVARTAESSPMPTVAAAAGGNLAAQPRHQPELAQACQGPP